MRLYRGLTRPFRSHRVRVPFQSGTPPGTNGTDFTDRPLAALGYAHGRRGVVLVIDLPEPLPRWVSEEYCGETGARRLMFWRLTWRRYVHAGYTRLGITPKQFFLLRQLHNRPFLHPAEIADMLYCDRPTATVVIRNMARLGWVEKARDPVNRKRYRVRATKAGREKFTSVRDSPSNPERLFSPEAGLTREELAILTMLLRKLLRHLGTPSKRRSLGL